MASIITAEFVLFAVTAAVWLGKDGFFTSATVSASSSSSVITPGGTIMTTTTTTTTNSDGASASLKNSAFVFVKPHANTIATQKLVREKLISSGCTILSESDIDGPTIDKNKLIDQHYYAIASKATILPAKDIPVPVTKFSEAFNEEWDTVLKDERAYNALDACTAFGCTASELNDAWQNSKAIKFGGGFYCALVTINNKSLYVFNAFFMTMRSKFVDPTVSIHTYEVEFNPTQLSWSDFRSKVLGPTDPAESPIGSLRRTILDQYKELGLSDVPNKGDNGVHASASPFEGLAEKLNWLGRTITSDSFGTALLQAGLTVDRIKAWSVDPQVVLSSDGTKVGSIFDALEDKDVNDCLAKLVELNGYNK